MTEAEAQVMSMSTLTEEGVMAVKLAACERLLASRVELKMQVRPLLLPPYSCVALACSWRTAGSCGWICRQEGCHAWLVCGCVTAVVR